MGQERGIALDSDVTTFLMQANTSGYDPANDADIKVAPEREAAFLIFLHVGRIIALPTVKKQVARIPDANFRDLHHGFALIHLEEPQVDESVVAARAQELRQYHKRGKGEEEDCRIIAEAEFCSAGVLLTFDAALRKHLGPQTRIQVLAPSEYWTVLAIPPGTVPVREPHPSHPLHGALWWRL